MTVTTAGTQRPWRRACTWLAFLAPFFFASYGFATWVTGRRTDVGAIVFDWERHVPFVSWTILPYWSIDVCYAISLFVCASRQELDAHARRLLTAQVIAIACFLAFPLRFSFDRPATDGAFGWLFDVLASFDQPFNQAPSLHIALLVILWALFAKHASGAWRWVVHAWAAIIGASVMTTWQHHFIDVPTGALLGFLCVWLWPLDDVAPLARLAWTRDGHRRRLAVRYLAGAVAAGVVAFAFRGALLWLLWVTVALLLVAACYAALGPEGFQKRDGRLSPAATAMLLPYMAGAWLNARWWTRGQACAVRVVDDVWIGRIPSRAELVALGVRGIVDMSAELPLNAGRLAYAHHPVLDLVPADARTLDAAATSIERLRADGGVLACCALGYSRSAAAVAAWLVATGRASDSEAAIERIVAVRPSIVLSDAHRAALRGTRTVAR